MQSFRLHFFVFTYSYRKILMQVESRINKNDNRGNSIRGTQRFTKYSPTVGDTIVQVHSETAISKLQNLAEREWQQLPNKKSTANCAFLFICINEADYSS